MEFSIVNLSELIHQKNKEKYGSKAFMLSNIKKYGFKVLPGFCILFHGGGKIPLKELGENKIFLEQYANLMKNGSGHKLIARSSGILEDKKGHSFPGIYRSISGIKSIQQLLNAVEQCYQSQDSEKAEWYNIQIQIAAADFFCVLVQLEIDPEYSGIIYTKLPFEGYWSGNCMMLQLVNGSCAALVRGEQKGNTYVIHDRLQSNFQIKSEAIQYRCLDKKVTVEPKIEQVIFQYLYKEGKKLVNVLGDELDIEWAYWHGEIYFFQVRPILEDKAKNDTVIQHIHDEYEELHIESKNDNGMKWNAMNYFIEQGMFEKWALLLDAHLSFKEVEKELNQAGFQKEELTVRFSYKNQIGMPRAFVYGKKEALRFIESNWTNECALIIYENICVRDSYELYIDKNKIILEHVPGVWESDSKLFSDTIVIHGKYTDFWRAETPREAKFENYYGSSTKLVLPLSKDELLEEYNGLQNYIAKIRQFAGEEHPVIVHYVRDDSKKVYFLNCRASEHIVDFCAYDKDICKIETGDDFKKWDKHTPILLCPDLSRGEEILLMQIVPYLKKVNVPIFVDFGILSHPAIMLREMGINITPRFMCHDHFTIFKSSGGKNER